MITFLISIFFFLPIPFQDAHPELKKQGKTQEKPIEISMTTDIKSTGSIFYSKVDLGELEPNKSYSLALMMTNTSLEDIAFDGIRPSCGCGRLFLEKGVIDSGESFPVAVEFDTPAVSENGLFVFGATIFKAGTEVGTFSFKGLLKNNLYVSPRAVFSVGTELETFVLPIVLSEPIRVRDLEVAIAESLGDIQAVIVMKDEKPYLQINAMGNSFDGEFATGDVTIQVKRSKRTVATNVLVTRRLPITISPTILRFRDDGSGNMTATCLVQLDKSLFEAEGNQKPRVQFSVAIGESKLQSNSKAMVPEIFKVALSMRKEEWPVPEVGKKAKKLEFTTVANGKIYRQFVKFIGE